LISKLSLTRDHQWCSSVSESCELTLVRIQQRTHTRPEAVGIDLLETNYIGSQTHQQPIPLKFALIQRRPSQAALARIACSFLD
jgi:hypothetical protein